MTAARLSPAASLLRNSKLFALPPAIALPIPEPSSEPVPRSDTATSIYPTRAAIETPLTSLSKGDWGFKRSLPLKSTTKSGSPSVRLNRGIDTAEHIADFDSAADHVLTLKKFQELNQSIQHPRSSSDARSKVHYGAFRKGYDNTTNTATSAPAHTKYTGVWPSISPQDNQKQMPQALRTQEEQDVRDQSAPVQHQRRSNAVSKVHRWRYDGPSLVQMSGLQFDQWIKTLDSTKKRVFRDYAKRDLLVKKRVGYSSRARDEGTVGDIDPATIEVSEEEVTNHLRALRQQPRAFGQLIADFLDLPEGPDGSTKDDLWYYGRDTLATDSYKGTGPPRTHPSAGLSYIHSNRWAQNHAVFGPQDQRQPVVARQVKTRARGANNVTNIGVAGFIVERSASAGTRDTNVSAFEPKTGGQKVVVKPDQAEIDAKGALKFVVKPAAEYQVEGDRAVHNTMVSQPRVAALRAGRDSGSRVMPALTRSHSGINYKKREDLQSKSGDEDFSFLDRTQ